MSAKDKEKVKEEEALNKYLHALTQKGKLGINVLIEGTKRTHAMQGAVDDELMRTDTTGMDTASRGFFELCKKYAIQHLHALVAQHVCESVAQTEAMEAEAAVVASTTDTSTAIEEDRVEDELENEEEQGGEGEAGVGEGYNGSKEEFDARVRDEE